MREAIMELDYCELELISSYYNQNLSYDEIIEREQFEYNFFVKKIIETLGSPPKASELRIEILPSDFDFDGTQCYKEIR